MKENWPKVPLGKVLIRSKRWIKIQPNETYKLVTVRLWGKGVVLRGQVTGAEIAASEMIQVQPNQFILSRIDARNGAFGLIPDALDGAIVSNDFPVFDIDTKCLLPAFLGWMSKTKDFVDFCKAASEGTTNRVRLKEDRFLATSILLPPLEEQRRIVAKIDALAAKIEEARGLRRKTINEIEQFLNSQNNMVFKMKDGWIEASVGDFCETPQYGFTASAITEPVGPKLLRITDIQDGNVNWDTVPYCECPTPEPYMLQENDIVFARTGATTGKSFLIRNCPEAIFASYLIRLRVKRLVTPEYLYCYFQTPFYWSQIIDEKKGTGQPNVNGKKLANMRVPIPPPNEQRRIVNYLNDLQLKVKRLKQLQVQTDAELNALLPSILDKAFKGEL